MNEDPEFKRLQTIAGRRSLVAILLNIPVVALMAWMFASGDDVALYITRRQWLVLPILLALIAFEGLLWSWMFGALVKHLEKSKVGKR